MEIEINVIDFPLHLTYNVVEDDLSSFEGVPLPISQTWNFKEGVSLPISQMRDFKDERGGKVLLFFAKGVRKMDVKFENFGFYRIESNYLKYLHSIDAEVQ